VAAWGAPADVLLQETFVTLKTHLDKIISQHFPSNTYPVLAEKVQ
jgi:hypothetical protein